MVFNASKFTMPPPNGLDYHCDAVASIQGDPNPVYYEQLLTSFIVDKQKRTALLKYVWEDRKAHGHEDEKQFFMFLANNPTDFEVWYRNYFRLHTT